MFWLIPPLDEGEEGVVLVEKERESHGASIGEEVITKLNQIFPGRTEVSFSGITRLLLAGAGVFGYLGTLLHAVRIRKWEIEWKHSTMYRKKQTAPYNSIVFTSRASRPEKKIINHFGIVIPLPDCLLYTSDAADE